MLSAYLFWESKHLIQAYTAEYIRLPFARFPLLYHHATAALHHTEQQSLLNVLTAALLLISDIFFWLV
ncbi:MAG: hypothetical protein IJY76_06405, partial [Anaerotignum sp.]|nr:hypothetical protein [Anaerotignum sp.]